MAKKPNSTERRTLSYPRGMAESASWLRFVQWDGFVRDWADLGLDDEDLSDLEICIMAHPDACPVIQGTGGVRKLRVSPAGWNVGKSGAVRVWYLHIAEKGVVILLVAYQKSDREDLTPSDKKAIKSLVTRIQKCFSDGVSA